jgi:hypothetical protein
VTCPLSIFLVEILYAFLISLVPNYIIYPDYLNLIDLVIIIIVEDELCSSLCHFPQPPVTSFHLGSNIPISALKCRVFLT